MISIKQADLIYSAQTKYILKHYGELSAQYANYGWKVDSSKVQTKVYGHCILISSINKDGRVQHREEEI